MTKLYNRKTGLVSVIIATYNYGKYIIDALNGLRRQIYPHIEVIVVDDASEDNTESLIESWKNENENCFENFIYLRLPRNSGAGWAYNIGFHISSGEFVVIHDSDDISHSRKIAKQVRLLNEHPDTAAVGTGYRTFKESIFQSKPGSYWLSFNPQEIERNYKKHLNHCVAYGTLMLRGAVLDELIGCFKEIPVGNDMFFVNNVINHDFIIENIHEELFFVRQHEGQMSSQIRQADIPVLKKRRVVEGLVSIVLPLKNSINKIYSALDSIGKQTYENIELIIVDDVSSDKAEDIINAWFKEYTENTENSSVRELIYFKLPNEAGHPWTTNIGSYISRGEYIAFHGDSGTSDPTRIEKQVDFLNSNFMYSAVGTNYSPGGKEIQYDEKIENSYINDFIHCINVDTLMVRYEIIHKTAGFNNVMQGAEDFEFIYRLLNNGYRVQNLREVLYFGQRS